MCVNKPQRGKCSISWIFNKQDFALKFWPCEDLFTKVHNVIKGEETSYWEFLESMKIFLREILILHSRYFRQNHFYPKTRSKIFTSAFRHLDAAVLYICTVKGFRTLSSVWRTLFYSLLLKPEGTIKWSAFARRNDASGCSFKLLSSWVSSDPWLVKHLRTSAYAFVLKIKRMWNCTHGILSVMNIKWASCRNNTPMFAIFFTEAADR